VQTPTGAVSNVITDAVIDNFAGDFSVSLPYSLAGGGIASVNSRSVNLQVVTANGTSSARNEYTTVQHRLKGQVNDAEGSDVVTTATSGTFNISRSGNTITVKHDTTTLYSATDAGAVIRVRIITADNDSTKTMVGTFSSITGPSTMRIDPTGTDCT
jgi:hypothetical protein